MKNNVVDIVKNKQFENWVKIVIFRAKKFEKLDSELIKYPFLLNFKITYFLEK